MVQLNVSVEAGFNHRIIFYTQSNRKKLDLLNIAIWGVPSRYNNFKHMCVFRGGVVLGQA